MKKPRGKVIPAGAVDRRAVVARDQVVKGFYPNYPIPATTPERQKATAGSKGLSQHGGRRGVDSDPKVPLRKL